MQAFSRVGDDLRFVGGHDLAQAGHAGAQLDSAEISGAGSRPRHQVRQPQGRSPMLPCANSFAISANRSSGSISIVSRAAQNVRSAFAGVYSNLSQNLCWVAFSSPAGLNA